MLSREKYNSDCRRIVDKYYSRKLEHQLKMDLKYTWSDRKYLMGRKWEKALRWLAMRLPKRIVMLSYFNVVSTATTGKYGDTVVPELTAMDAIQRWSDEVGVK